MRRPAGLAFRGAAGYPGVMAVVSGPVEIEFAKGRASLDKAAKEAAGKAAALLSFYPLCSAVLTAGAAPGEKSPARLADRRAAAVTRWLTGPGGASPEQLMVVVERSDRPEVSILVIDRPVPGL